MKKAYLKKSLALLPALLAAGVLVSTTAQAAGFVNGGFETGDFTGWTQQGGTWYGGSYNLGSRGPNNTIVTPGNDPIVAQGGAGLNQVYAGNYAARVNDWVNDNGVSTISQHVTNYTDNDMFFEWAAVLESSHGSTDSDHFSLTLTDDTTGTTLINRQYNSYNNGPIFSSVYATGFDGWYSTWYYTNGWQVEHLDLAALGAVGHDFTLSLLASDCPYGGHAGYVYLDGFAQVIVPPGPDPVPEPATMLLMGTGLAGLAGIRRKTKAA